MSLNFDIGIIDVLEKCDLLHLRKQFIGQTKADLTRLLKKKPQKLQKLLHQILKNGADPANLQQMIKTIIDELTNQQDDDAEEEHPFKRIKTEKVEIKKEKEETGQELDVGEDDDIEIIAHIPGEVSIQKEVKQRDKAIACVNIEDDVDGNSSVIIDPSPLQMQVSHPGVGKAVRGRPRKTTFKIPKVQSQKKKDTSTDCVEIDDEDSSTVIVPVNSPAQSTVSSAKRGRRRGGRPAQNAKTTNDDSRKSPEDPFLIIHIVDKLKDFEESQFVNLGEVSWTEWMRSGTKKIYFHLPAIEELHILAECKNRKMVARPLPLPRLKILMINNNGGFNYGQEIRNIIQGTGGNLEEIDFTYNFDNDLPKFLAILGSLDQFSLQRLKYLQIQCGEAILKPMNSKQLEMLAEIKAPNLEELYLGLSLWEDAKSGLEKVLDKFSTLKKMMIKGYFVTEAKRQPSITINFPSMPNLERLDFGGIYTYSSIIENLKERPAKKWKKFQVAQEPMDDGGKHAQRSKDEADSHQKVFTVGLNLPILPTLTTLVLGCHYDIEDLHFSKMPALEKFRVSSPWHISVKFPKPERNKVYSTITELQFPDSLKNPGFVQQVLPYFPNVTKWYFNLPSVSVVRGFAHCMKNASRSLALLDMKLQYDFPSSLDWIMLNEPWNTAPPTKDERRKLKILKEYPHWEEFVQINGIELPQHTDPGPNERFSGLEVLSEKFLKRDKALKLQFLPKILRLPKGPHHFNDDECQFTDTLIGFEDNAYPFGKKAWSKTPKGIEALNFHLKNVPHKKTRVLNAVPCYAIDPTISSPIVPKAEQMRGRPQ